MNPDKKRQESGGDMDKSTKPICIQLHRIEDYIIQISGLIKALQQIQSDDSAKVCIAFTIEERIESLKYHFYQHRKELF